jgi:hypothetical protein
MVECTCVDCGARSREHRDDMRNGTRGPRANYRCDACEEQKDRDMAELDACEAQAEAEARLPWSARKRG